MSRSWSSCLLATLAFASGGAAAHSQMQALATDGSSLGGRLEVERLTIPAKATVWVDADLELVSRGDVVIEGTLVARPGSRASGNSISIRSAGAIVVTGRIAAGDGSEGRLAGVEGGRGGDLRLEAPLILASADLAAGRGGDGGPGARGGDGGKVLVAGRLIAQPGPDGELPALRAGDGGAGGDGLAGPSGGDGGDGGLGGSIPPPAAGDGIPGTPGITGMSVVQSTPGSAGSFGGPCTPGGGGSNGLMAIAGHGGDGGDGGPAVALAGTGGAGGAGGAGGSTPPPCATYGQTCQDAGDCCNDVPCTAGICRVPLG